MKYPSALRVLIPLIFILTLVATLAGLWPGEGQPYSLTNFRGEAITINARGLYYWDTVSSAAQMQANDLVGLVLGLPLLAISFWFTLRGSLRGRLLLTGTLGFILYTYITMCFGAAYNKLFLVYVALFSLSLFAFILSMMSFDLKTLPAHFSKTLPRGWIAGLLFFAAAFLTIAWLGRITHDPCARSHSRVGKRDQHVHPGHGFGHHRPVMSARRHSAPAPGGLGLPVGLRGADEIPDHGHRRQPDGPQYGPCGCTRQRCRVGYLPDDCPGQRGDGGAAAQKYQR